MNALTVLYRPDLNRLYLLNDAGTAYSSGYAPGIKRVLSNSQGSLDCAKTRVTRLGNQLTVAWSLTAASGFSGQKDVALFISDRAGLRDGFETRGTWTITGAGLIVSTLSQVSTASASGAGINLVFAGVVPQSGYAVAVNGAQVEVTNTSVKGGKVSLSLAQSLHSGDQVVVTWTGGSKALVAS